VRFGEGGLAVLFLISPCACLTPASSPITAIKCKWNYDVKWEKAENNRCPNLVARNGTVYKLNVKTQQTRFKKTDFYDSLADMWSEWYLQARFWCMFTCFA